MKTTVLKITIQQCGLTYKITHKGETDDIDPIAEVGKYFDRYDMNQLETMFHFPSWLKDRGIKCRLRPTGFPHWTYLLSLVVILGYNLLAWTDKIPKPVLRTSNKEGD